MKTIAVNHRRTSPAVHKQTLRIVIASFVFALIFFFGALIHVNAGSPDDAAFRAKSETVFVEPGDTLWTIAKAHMPKGTNIRSYIHETKTLNHLKSESLQIGQALVLPSR